jgi:ABC-2 type transport system permease protein
MTATTPSPATASPAAAHTSTFADLPVPGFGATFGSEWIKLWTARAPRRNLVLGTILGIALSGLLALAVGATFSEWSAADQVEFDPVLFSFSGSILTAIFFIAVGARVATSEYSSDMIRLTLAATPSRDRVLAAKLLTVSLVTWAFGAVAMVGMVVASQAVFAGYDLRTASVFEGEVLRTLALIVLSIPLFPVLGVVGGVLFRSTAPTITVVLLLLFFPSFFGGLFPTSWQENVFSLFPGSASDALTIGHLTESAMYLDAVPALVVVVAWLVVPVVVAGLVLRRRDA